VARLDRLTAKVDELLAANRPRVTRSAMSAAEKSRYIRKHGLPAYQSLPLK
jgi:hypothetical protein